MGAGFHGGFGNTSGSRDYAVITENKTKPEKQDITRLEKQDIITNSEKKQKNKDKKPIFDKNGTVTKESIRNRAEFFLGKPAARLEHELQKHGYETMRRPSKNSGSKAKIIVTLNPSKEKNITQLQVSPGSKRHGNVPYVKISTTDIGIIKIIGSSKSEYKTDHKEKATLLFRRDKS